MPKNRAMMKMKTTPRKITSSFEYLPNLMVRIVLIIGNIAAIPTRMNSSDLCAQRLGFQLKSKWTGMTSGSDG